MVLVNPVYALILPFLFIFTLPVALFATLTTLLAFSILLLRVLAVYFELALAVIPYYVLGLEYPPALLSPSTSTQKGPSYSQPTATSPIRRRKRRSSSSSNLSVKSLSNSGILTPTPIPVHAADTNPARDYEGVGGWRVLSHSDDDNDDVLWTSINQRLELPADHIRRHHRSSTREGRAGGSGSWSPENVMNSSRSRARTPSENRVGMVMGEGSASYFSHPVSPSIGKGNRRTQSGSSGSSKGSGERRLSMKAC